MFCPSCGVEERETNQFCRACGNDLRSVRFALEKPDTITASAAKARTEIGHAFANRIREISSAKALNKIAEEGLPHIEKFLESPEERRLRRIRTGSLIAFIGLGASIAFTIISTIADKDLIIMAGLGLVAFFIGLSFIINGLLFSVPKKVLEDKTSEGETQRKLDFKSADTNELQLPQSGQSFSSVIEDTTQHLQEKQTVAKK